MNRLGEVILNLVKKTGFPHTDANLKEIAALTTPVPDEVEEALSSLMNNQEAEAWAKGQVSIKNHYTAQAYNGIDKNIISNAEKFGFSEDEIEQLKAERNTGKKQDMFTAILNSRLEEAKKNAATAKKDKDPELEAKFIEEQKQLRSQLNKQKEEHENALKAKDQEIYNFKKNSRISSVLNSQKWSDNYPEHLRNELGLLAIQKKLEKEGATLALDEKDEIKIVRADNPDMPYFDSSNKIPNFTEFATKTLSENKFLAVSTPVQPNTTIKPLVAPVTGQPNTTKRPNSVSGLLQQSLKDQQG
jgi:hypothetical protein